MTERMTSARHNYWAEVPQYMEDIVSKDGNLNLNPANDSSRMREPMNTPQMDLFRARLRATLMKHKLLTGLGDIKRLTAEPALVIAFAVDILRVLEDTKALDACLIWPASSTPRSGSKR